jgi:glycosyltransferase involved in cell wall biosynthesis
MVPEGNVGQKGRWFTVLLMQYYENPSFWERDAGLFHQGFRSLGIDSYFVALGEDRVDKERRLMLCPQAKLQDPSWWRQWELEGVVLYSWAIPKFEPIARAIKAAGLKLVLILDTQGIHSPHVWLSKYVRMRWIGEKEAGRWFPLAQALLRTAVNSFKGSYTSILAHLEHGDALAIPSRVAIERYGRFLAAVGRPDLKKNIRFIPHPVAAYMIYDPSRAKKPLLVAVGRWEMFVKNAPFLVKVLGRVLSEAPDYYVRIIGSGEDYVRKLVSGLDAGCRSRIEIPGPVRNPELPPHYQEAQICICPSYTESFHIPSGEAMCCGCSVVGDAQIASMPYFVSLGAGTVSCNGTLNNFADAVLAEIAAWRAGERDPAKISKAAIAKFHPEKVAAAVMEAV